MFKKIAILGILIGIFITGNLLASDRPWFDIDLTTHGYANTIHLGYIDMQDVKHVKVIKTCVSSGHYGNEGFYIDYDTEPPPNKIYAEGWGPYNAYDYDDCEANPNNTHYLELWIGCTPPGEEDPEQ